MYLQDVTNVYDLLWADTIGGAVSYGNIFLENEKQQSTYNFNFANENAIVDQFLASQKSCQTLCDQNLYLPAYEKVLDCSHLFNLLDARGVVSVNERARYIKDINALAARVASSYVSNIAN